MEAMTAEEAAVVAGDLGCQVGAMVVAVVAGAVTEVEEQVEVEALEAVDSDLVAAVEAQRVPVVACPAMVVARRSSWSSTPTRGARAHCSCVAATPRRVARAIRAAALGRFTPTRRATSTRRTTLTRRSMPTRYAT